MPISRVSSKTITALPPVNTGKKEKNYYFEGSLLLGRKRKDMPGYPGTDKYQQYLYPEIFNQIKRGQDGREPHDRNRNDLRA